MMQPHPAVEALASDVALNMDLRGTPAHECVCGSNMFTVVCSFDEYEVSMYLLDMQCVGCGSLLTAPTLVDHPQYEPDTYW
jgi:hypothetical protein